MVWSFFSPRKADDVDPSDDEEEEPECAPAAAEEAPPPVSEMAGAALQDTEVPALSSVPKYGGAAHRTADTKHFAAFVKSAKWDPVDARRFIEVDGTIRDFIFRRFAMYVEKVQLEKKYSDLFKPCMAWCQYELNRQLKCHPRWRIEKPNYVLSISDVKDINKRLRKGTREYRVIHRKDLQASVGTRIEKEMMVTMMEKCATASVAHTVPLHCFQTGVETRLGHAALQRHDDMRALMFCMMFVTPLEQIGPNGMKALCFVHDGGKTNVSAEQFCAILCAQFCAIL